MDNSVSLSMRELLERRQPRLSEESSGVAQLTSATTEEYQAFANGRIGSRPQLSVIFRKASGAACCFSYAHLFTVESENPEAGCIVTFSAGKSVHLRGRNLAQLFDCICFHKAAEIAEAHRSIGITADGSAPIVEAIEFQGAKRVPNKA